MNSILLPSIKDYQKGISPLLPPSCCEYPTYSHYAVEGVKKIVGYQPEEVLKAYLKKKVTIK